MVALLVAPSFALVPPSYKEGEIVTRTIVVAEDVNLPDERSTQTRIEEALKETPPVYDFDPQLATQTTKRVREAFKMMRLGQQELEQNLQQAEEALRQNSLERVELLQEIGAQLKQQQHLGKERSHALRKLGSLGDVENLDERSSIQAARLRQNVGGFHTVRQQLRSQVQTKREQLEILENDIEFLQENIRDARLLLKQTAARLQEDFESQLEIPVPPQVLIVLTQQRFNQTYENALAAVLLVIYSERFTISPELLAEEKAVQIQDVSNGEITRLENLSELGNLQRVRQQIPQQLASLLPAATPASTREALLLLAQSLTRPNITENKNATEALKRRLRQEVSPVFFALKKGDVVARARDVATAQQAEIIRAINAHNRKHPKYAQILGTLGLVLLLLALARFVIVPRILHQDVTRSRQTLLAVVLLGNLAISQLLLLLEPAFNTLYQLPFQVYSLLLPVALTSMLVSIVAGQQVGMLMGLLQAIFHAILLGNQLTFFLYGAVSSVVAAAAPRYDRRAAIWQQGTRIGLANIVTTIVLMLISQRSFSPTSLGMLAAAFSNGILVAVLCTALLPLIEKLFDLTTNLRLLELANINQPALKQLSATAPGTYQHSVVVSNLSEGAADGIRANPLLVRVASYYHDLGKMNCPLYFVENQKPDLNYHEQLAPEVSARIIVNHVQDGLLIARQHNLGRAICAIIQQHHGTSLVRYFFHKAKKESSSPIDETIFRYKGPKPQSKEAGLVMAADMTEASTRSLKIMTPKSVRKMIQDITSYLYTDGQLEESGLTFNDLNYIEKTFTRMILSVHHHRVQYPGQPGHKPPKGD